MKTFKVKNIIIGEKKPKVIVPIVEKTIKDVLNQAKKIANEPFDIIEWRADCLERELNKDELTQILNDLHDIINNKALLVTYRRKCEGGEGNATLAEYENFCSIVLESNKADFLDIELSVGDELANKLATKANINKCISIFSQHDFAKTPNVDEMMNTLCTMQNLGADIAKLAVMPNTPADVLNLFTASQKMKELHPQTLILTISMGELGAISRVCGATFGSCMTFASLGKASAPGQINLDDMNNTLNSLYSSV